MRQDLQTVAIPNDRTGLAMLMALAARPPSGRTPDRVNKAIAVIRQYAAQGFYDHYGYDHPDNPRNSRSRLQRRTSLNLLFADLEKAVTAGRAFHSSLRDRRVGGMPRAPLPFLFIDGDTSFELPIASGPHTTWIEREYSSMAGLKNPPDIKNVRKAMWDMWLPTIHVSAAFSLLIDSNIEKQGPLNWRVLCHSMLFGSENDHLTAWIAKWAREFEKFAEELHFWSRNRPIRIDLDEPFRTFVMNAAKRG